MASSQGKGDAMRVIWPDGISSLTLADWRRHGVKWHILSVLFSRGGLYIEVKAQFVIGVKIDGSRDRLDVWIDLGPLAMKLACKR